MPQIIDGLNALKNHDRNISLGAFLIAVIFGEAIGHDLPQAWLLFGGGCAGADVNWMKDSMNQEYDKTYQDSLELALCLKTLYHFPVPVIVMAHGAVYGGGIGLLAAADIAVCSKETKFCFSEVSLGLVPAIISPYVIRRVGENKAKEWMLTGNRFLGEEAARYGLVNMVEESYNLDATVQGYLQKFKDNSREAMIASKKLISRLASFQEEEKILQETTDVITQARISHDGQEGMAAFLEKRKPRWI